MKKIKEWWIAFHKWAGDWCEKHQHTTGMLGCMDCLGDSMEEFHTLKAKKAEEKLRHEANVYAEEIAPAMEQVLVARDIRRQK